MIRPVNLLLIEDHRLFSEGLALLLSTQEDHIFLGAATPKEALERAHSLPVEIILIAATIGRSEAIRLLQLIKEDLPKVHVIMLGVENEERTILEFIEAGISGYVLKDASLGEFLQTIKAIHHGQTLCSRRIAAQVFAQINKLSSERDQAVRLFGGKLSLREQEVLQLIAAGLSNREIAERLFISLPTVKNHVHNILTKLQVNCRSEAIHSARQNRFLIRSEAEKRSISVSGT